MKEIIQLKIKLAGSNPPIWRRVLVAKNATFLDLHYTIQIAMGWENYHLFEFKINNNRIGIPDEDFDDMGYGPSKVLHADQILLEKLIRTTGEEFIYEYDFGDGWIHKITVEKFLPRDSKKSYPVCIDGKLNCPPEDCGGIPGYYNLLEITGDKNHPDYREMISWLGGTFDAGYFDIDKINKILSEYGSLTSDERKDL